MKYTAATYKLLTIILIGLAIIQEPFFFYYTSGMAAIFIIIPFVAIALALTIILLTPWIRRKQISLFHKIGVVISIAIGTIGFFWGSAIIEKLDWDLRFQERQIIVEKAINGEYNLYKTQLDCFPPLSNGGNEIIIDNKPNGSITVTFFIDRGFIDHYSAFIYTTDSARIKRFDKRTKSDWHKTNKKISENWYRIAE